MGAQPREIEREREIEKRKRWGLNLERDGDRKRKMGAQPREIEREK